MQNMPIKQDAKGNVFVTLSGLIYLIEYGYLLPDALIASIQEDDSEHLYTYKQSKHDEFIYSIESEDEPGVSLSFSKMPVHLIYYIEAEYVNLDDTDDDIDDEGIDGLMEDIEFLRSLSETHGFDINDPSGNEPFSISGESDGIEWQVFLLGDDDDRDDIAEIMDKYNQLDDDDDSLEGLSEEMVKALPESILKLLFGIEDISEIDLSHEQDIQEWTDENFQTSPYFKEEAPATRLTRSKMQEDYALESFGSQECFSLSDILMDVSDIMSDDYI